MTATKTKPLVPGDVVHFVNPGIALGTKENDIQGAFVCLGERATALVITDEILRVNRDRNGNSPLDLVDDEEAQIRRWGERKIARGPVPDGLSWFVPGSAEHEFAYQEAKSRIDISTQDLDERAYKIAVLDRSELGRGRPQNKNTTTYLTDY
jgi:hypothetical protein